MFDLNKQVIGFTESSPLKKSQLPSKQHESDVGFDLFADQKTVLLPGKVTKVSTGLIYAGIMAFSGREVKRFFTKIEGRSGLASKGIFPVGGIIDPDYRGEVMVLLFNSTNESYVLEEGDRCAQLVPYSLVDAEVQFVASAQPTARGSGGFGSTGK